VVGAAVGRVVTGRIRTGAARRPVGPELADYAARAVERSGPRPSPRASGSGRALIRPAGTTSTGVRPPTGGVPAAEGGGRAALALPGRPLDGLPWRPIRPAVGVGVRRWLRWGAPIRGLPAVDPGHGGHLARGASRADGPPASTGSSPHARERGSCVRPASTLPAPCGRAGGGGRAVAAAAARQRRARRCRGPGTPAARNAGPGVCKAPGCTPAAGIPVWPAPPPRGTGSRGLAPSRAATWRMRLPPWGNARCPGGRGCRPDSVRGERGGTVIMSRCRGTARLRPQGAGASSYRGLWAQDMTSRLPRETSRTQRW